MQEKALQLPKSREQQDPTANYGSEGLEDSITTAIVGSAEKDYRTGDAGWKRRTMIENIPPFINSCFEFGI